MSTPEKVVGCHYPQSVATRRPIATEIAGLVQHRRSASSIYLEGAADFTNPNFGPIPVGTEGSDHHQGLARTHRFTDGSVWFFLSHSEMESGEEGILAQFRYRRQLAGEHVLSGSPVDPVPRTQLLHIHEQHPSDIVFLGDVNRADSGYLFVAEESTSKRVEIYRWSPGHDLDAHGHINHSFGGRGPNLLLLDRVGSIYYLALVSTHSSTGIIFTARQEALFPRCTPGSLDVAAWTRSPSATFRVALAAAPSQIKLVRDSTSSWFVLAYRSDPEDDEGGTDYIDVYRVRFGPFSIGPRLSTTHVYFPSGDTGFASTGTHHVEASGRLLVSSSYRWSEAVGFPPVGFVSRVDELTSS
jgi:hypothetical protein